MCPRSRPALPPRSLGSRSLRPTQQHPALLQLSPVFGITLVTPQGPAQRLSLRMLLLQHQHHHPDIATNGPQLTPAPALLTARLAQRLGPLVQWLAAHAAHQAGMAAAGTATERHAAATGIQGIQQVGKGAAEFFKAMY